MKIGDEYKSERVAPRDFDNLAEQTGLAKPLVRRRVPELAQTILDAMGKVTINQEVAQNVAALIRKRCATILKRFTGCRASTQLKAECVFALETSCFHGGRGI